MKLNKLAQKYEKKTYINVKKVQLYDAKSAWTYHICEGKIITKIVFDTKFLQEGKT